MLEFNQYLETIDLRGLHWVVSFLGVLLCVYAMQSWSHGVVPGDDHFPIVNGLRRFALWLMALAFLWDLGYAEQHPKWQPWPSDLAAIIAVDIFLFSAMVSTYMRRWRDRHPQRFDAASQI